VPARTRRIVEDGLEHDGGRAPVEGAGASGELVQHGAEREEIAARVERLHARLLRRHVEERAERRAGARQLALLDRGGHLRLDRGGGVQARDQLGQAEVEDLHLARPREEDVGRLDVAVHDALVVGGREPVGHLDRELQQAVGPDRPALDERLEGLHLQHSMTMKGSPACSSTS
jgi:hypothetical protein